MNRKQLNQITEIMGKVAKAFNKGNFDLAEKLLKNGLALASWDFQLWYNLGLVYEKKGNREGALAAYKKAVELSVAYPEANFAIFRLYMEMEYRPEAEAHLRGFLRAAPGYAWAWRELGMLCSVNGNDEEAEEHYARCLRMNPKDIDGLYYSGRALIRLSKYNQAVERFSSLLELSGDQANNWVWRGVAYFNLSLFDEAILDFKKAISLDSHSFLAWSNLGATLLSLGLPQEALAAHSKAMEINPDYNEGRRKMLSGLLYVNDMDRKERFRIIREYGARLEKDIQAYSLYNLTNDKIKVGYISSDFRLHPVARNMKQILAHADRKTFSLHAYAHESKRDDFTIELEKYFDSWLNINKMTDKEVAARIKDDKIDILVILAGRFDQNRPGIMAFRPAPIQLSYHDGASLGMDSVNYIISDTFMTPKNRGELFTERPLRMPSFYLHDKIESAPAINELPMRESGKPTFICCNFPGKIGAQVLELWKELLDNIPGSKLILKYLNSYGNKSLSDRIQNKLEDKVELLTGELSLSEHLRLYNKADLALDVFPFSGSTTSFESLYMGVPVITLPGENMIGRWTGSMLKTLNMPEFIADSPEEYIRIANYWISNPLKLAEIRLSLRKKVEESSLVNGKLKARHLERLYRALLRTN